ncbi:MAG: hypothetical protein ACTSWY_10630 [Promethearchaeota archaeon]
MNKEENQNQKTAYDYSGLIKKFVLPATILIWIIIILIEIIIELNLGRKYPIDRVLSALRFFTNLFAGVISLLCVFILQHEFFNPEKYYPVFSVFFSALQPFFLIFIAVIKFVNFAISDMFLFFAYLGYFTLLYSAIIAEFIKRERRDSIFFIIQGGFFFGLNILLRYLLNKSVWDFYLINFIIPIFIISVITFLYTFVNLIKN